VAHQIGLHCGIHDFGEFAAAEEASALRPNFGAQPSDQLLLCHQQAVFNGRVDCGLDLEDRSGRGYSLDCRGTARRKHRDARVERVLALRAFEAVYHDRANNLRFATGNAGPARTSASLRNSRTIGLRGTAMGSGWPELAAAPADFASYESVKSSVLAIPFSKSLLPVSARPAVAPDSTNQKRT